MEPENWYVYFKSSPGTLTTRRACQRAPCLHKEGAPKPHGHSPSIMLPKLAINPSSRPRATSPGPVSDLSPGAGPRSGPLLTAASLPVSTPQAPRNPQRAKQRETTASAPGNLVGPVGPQPARPGRPNARSGRRAAGPGPAEGGRLRGANLQAGRVGARGLGERLAARTPELPPRLPGDEGSALPQFLRAAAERGLRDLRALGTRAAAGPGRELPGGGRRGTGLRSERLHRPGGGVARLPPVAAGSGPARAGEGRLLTCADRPRSAPES